MNDGVNNLAIMFDQSGKVIRVLPEAEGESLVGKQVEVVENLLSDLEFRPSKIQFAKTDSGLSVKAFFKAQAQTAQT